MGFGDEEVVVGVTFKVTAGNSREEVLKAFKEALIDGDIVAFQLFQNMTEGVQVDEGLEPA